jgi:hypothetical protein
MADYEPLRGYLHADRLRFSYGAMRDRAADWQDGLVGAPASIAAVAAAAAGFDGVWLDRRGYQGTGDAVEAAMATAAGAPARRSADGSFVFVSLTGLRARLGDAGRLRRSVLAPVHAAFGPGFYPREMDDRHLWNWATGPADLVLDNPRPEARTMILRATVDAAQPGPLTLSAAGATATVTAGQPVELRVVVGPGRSVVRVTSNAPSVTAPDRSTLAFRLTDASLVDAALYDAAARLGIGPTPAAPVV